MLESKTHLEFDVKGVGVSYRKPVCVKCNKGDAGPIVRQPPHSSWLTWSEIGLNRPSRLWSGNSNGLNSIVKLQTSPDQTFYQLYDGLRPVGSIEKVVITQNGDFSEYFLNDSGDLSFLVPLFICCKTLGRCEHFITSSKNLIGFVTISLGGFGLVEHLVWQLTKR